MTTVEQRTRDKHKILNKRLKDYACVSIPTHSGINLTPIDHNLKVRDP